MMSKVLAVQVEAAAKAAGLVVVSSEPGLVVGMVVRVTSYRSRTLWPPNFCMKAGPLSGLPSGPSLRFGPWHIAQLAR